MKKQQETVKADYIDIINEYYINGFNRTKAVRAVQGNHISANSAYQTFNRALNHPETQVIIRERNERLKKATDIQSANILRELLNIAYSDATDYIDLDKEQIKELPADVRRCIESYKVKKRHYKTRDGDPITEETVEIKLVDKMKAIEMINKHLGFYEEDNKQRKPKINIDTLNVNVLNAILKAHNEHGPELTG